MGHRRAVRSLDIAVLVVSIIVLGMIMVDLPLGLCNLELYALHKSVGILILALTVGRLAWRLRDARPVPLGSSRLMSGFALTACMPTFI